MRISVHSFKNNKHLQDRPKAGTKLGDMYEELVEIGYLKFTVPVDKNTISMIKRLKDAYELKIKRIGSGIYQLDRSSLP